MRGSFDDEEIEQAGAQRDTEVTLGNGTLVLLALGLVLVCAVCFGAGYAVGHHRAQPQVEASEPQGAAPVAQGNGSLSKPSASAQQAAAPAAQSTPALGDAVQPGAAPTGAVQQAPAVAVAVPVSGAASQAAAPASQPVVRPVLPVAVTAPPAFSASTARGAIPAAGQWVVQIAAVSHQEDADVLTGALRRRGYAVNARRDAADNLIHVRVGPFNNRDEANRWRMKLLDDGYNAIIQP